MATRSWWVSAQMMLMALVVLMAVGGAASGQEAAVQPRRAPVPPRSIYVSEAHGNDRHTGLNQEQPVQTTHRALQLSRANAVVHFERGGTYDAVTLPSIEGLHIKAYGEGARPILRGHRAIFAAQRNRFARITIEDMHLIGEGGGTGIMWLGTTQGLTVRNCVIEDYTMGMVIQGANDRPITEVVLEGNVVRNTRSADSHSHGIYANFVHGFTVRNCFFDRTGYSGENTGTIFNHALYIQIGCSPIVFENNVSSRSFADGGQFRSGGIVRGNVSIYNPIGYDIGGVRGGSDPIEGGIDLTFTDNIIAFPGDINTNHPRGIGLLLGNLRRLHLRDNHFLFARGGRGARNTALRIVDVGESSFRELDISGNRVQAFPTVLDNQTDHPLELGAGLLEVDGYDPDERCIHAWLDEAGTRWGEPGYDAASLRRLILGEREGQ